MGKEQRVNVRVEEDLRKDFDYALEITGMGETQFVKAAIKALCEYVREHGEITMPLALLPKSAVKRSQRKESKPAKAPVQPVVSGRSDAPVNLNPSTASTRFSLNETPPQKSSGPRPRSTRGIKKVSNPNLAKPK